MVYRGSLLISSTDRGRLNVINELPLEDYLRGVVPREMGPEVFNQLEALKAQSVAARTYTVRNLGEFAEEGYDICSTPRRQVYGGRSVEHPSSDRAIRETEGLVALWRGEPIDALYSATSGGHTEDVGTVFPLKKDELYLRGTPDSEARPRAPPRRQPGPQQPFPRRPGRAAPAAPPGSPAGAPGHPARKAGRPRPADPAERPPHHLGGARWPATPRLDLRPGADRRLVRGDLAALVAEPPPDWAQREMRLA